MTTTATIINHGGAATNGASRNAADAPALAEETRVVARPAAASSMPALMRMLQLSSSLCPIGAFAYSQGLETAMERGWVTDEPTLVAWICGLGEHGLARLDLPLLLRAHEAALRWDEPRLVAIAERVLANREARELAEQERQLGSSLASLLANLGMQRAAVFKGHPSASYVVSFAAGAAFFGMSPELALTGYCFAWCEQQVSAAARLGPLGHMAAQRALSAALEQAPRWVAAGAALADERIGSATPGLAASAAWHETQYTRLFRS
jgi:urease accessory protein